MEMRGVYNRCIGDLEKDYNGVGETVYISLGFWLKFLE